MSNESSGVDRADDGTGNTTRVGTVERDRAIALLQEHWQAGRLDPAEHELRVTRARAAVTRADLDVLFADLPRAGQPPSLEPAGAVGDTGAAASGGAPGGVPGLLGGKRDTIIALTPFAALFLFFVTGSWLWFLMVPVMGILLYGPGGKKKPKGSTRT